MLTMTMPGLGAEKSFFRTRPYDYSAKWSEDGGGPEIVPQQLAGGIGGTHTFCCAGRCCRLNCRPPCQFSAICSPHFVLCHCRCPARGGVVVGS
jgi:hypothetical protein